MEEYVPRVIIDGKWGTGHGEFGIRISEGELIIPDGITVDDKGNLYIMDIVNNRIQVFDSSNSFKYKVDVISFQEEWSKDKRTPLLLNFPEREFEIDNEGYLNVFNIKSEMVKQFDLKGHLIKTIQLKEYKEKRDKSTSEIIFFKKKNQIVIKLDNDGKTDKKFTLPEHLSLKNYNYNVHYLDSDMNNNFYFLLEDHILIFDTKTNFSKEFKMFPMTTQFDEHSICIDKKGNIYQLRIDGDPMDNIAISVIKWIRRK